MVLAGAEEGVSMTNDDVQARIDALKAKGDEAAEEATKEREPRINWNKGVQPGQMLAGIMERGDRVFKDGWDAPRYLLEVRDMETKELYTVWCGNYMLERAIVDQCPAPGSLIVVQFHGKEKSQSNPNRSFNNFTLESETSDVAYWQDVDQKFQMRQSRKSTSSIGSATTAPRFGPDEAPF